jgi:uncharacterized protein (DUF1684 family)
MRAGLGAHVSVSVLVVAATAFLSARGTTPSISTPPAYDAAATEAWRAQRETALKGPDGWLSVAGLFFLKPGANTLGTDPASDIALPPGSAPEHAGRILFENGRARLELEPEVLADATINKQPINGPVDLRGSSPAEHRPADLARIGRLTLLLHRSGERAAIRLRDPESPIRRDFTGVKWYPVEAKWQVTGTLTKFPEPRQLEVANVLGDVTDETSPGEVTVTLDGKTLKLLPLIEDGRLWFIFSDSLAGTENYRIRFLYADFPTGKSTHVTLDFNRAYNPPCAYNPYTTCPLPPPQNRLRIPVRAGERAYGPHAESKTAAR